MPAIWPNALQNGSPYHKRITALSTFDKVCIKITAPEKPSGNVRKGSISGTNRLVRNQFQRLFFNGSYKKRHVLFLAADNRA